MSDDKKPSFVTSGTFIFELKVVTNYEIDKEPQLAAKAIAEEIRRVLGNEMLIMDLKFRGFEKDE